MEQRRPAARNAEWRSRWSALEARDAGKNSRPHALTRSSAVAHNFANFARGSDSLPAIPKTPGSRRGPSAVFVCIAREGSRMDSGFIVRSRFITALVAACHALFLCGQSKLGCPVLKEDSSIPRASRHVDGRRSRNRESTSRPPARRFNQPRMCGCSAIPMNSEGDRYP